MKQGYREGKNLMARKDKWLEVTELGTGGRDFIGNLLPI